MERGCPNCGRMIDASLSECPYCQYNLNKLNKFFKHYESEANVKIPKYAGFIKRMAANSIDYLLFLVIFTIIEAIYLYFVMPSVYTNFVLEKLSLYDFIIMFIPYLSMPIFYFFYCVFMQCCKKMGTIGEAFVGIEVVDDLECPLTFGLSFKRNFFRFLNVITCGIGTLMIIFTKKKQSLNDIASNTFVLNRLSHENYGGFGYAHLFKRLLAFVIDIIVLYGIYVLFGYLENYIAGLHIEMRTQLLKASSILMLVIMLLYFPYTESHSGGSIGKLFMKIRVRTLSDDKLSFFRSLFRFIAFGFELLMLPFGTLLAFVTPRKQAFKDMLSKTVVVDK